VDGIYTADPRSDPDATKIDRLTHLEVLSRDLRVMDSTAITHARENSLPIVVFDLLAEGSLRALLSGEPIGTIVE
jgi:uridylate kinase